MRSSFASRANIVRSLNYGEFKRAVLRTFASHHPQSSSDICFAVMRDHPHIPHYRVRCEIGALTSRGILRNIGTRKRALYVLASTQTTTGIITHVLSDD